MQKPTKIGVIGAGAIGRDHLKSLRRMDQVGGVLVFDASRDSARRASEEMGVSVSGSLEELLERSDLVWICTPPHTHLEHVRAACAAGKAIFCEKPLAHDLKDAVEIARVVGRAGVRFFMGHSGRFSAPFSLMRKLVGDGVVGRPQHLFSTRLGRLDPATAAPWRLDDRFSGGAIVELGVHEIDFINWMMECHRDGRGGRWASVFALGGSTLVGPRFQDSLVSVGAMAGGATARLEVSWSSARYLWERGVQGDNGNVLYFNDADFNTLILHQPGRVPEEFKTGEVDWKDDATGENLSLRAQAQAVLGALTRGEAPPVGLDDGFRAVAVAQAMRQSARSGRVESVDEMTTQGK